MVGIGRLYEGIGREKMMDALYNMAGKAVVIDGCHVGYARTIGLEQEESHITMHLDIAMTDDTIDKLREYAYLMSIFDSKDNENS